MPQLISQGPEARPSVSTGLEQPARNRAGLTPLQFDLAGALPPLWRKANNKHLTAREQHKKLLELLIWVAGKHGYSARQRCPIQYWQNHVKKDGRIDVRFVDAKGAPALLVELDWTRNESSIHKLQAAAIAKAPILWISGVPFATKDDARQLRTFANEATGKPTGWWLPLFHLEHGWL
jgi:hypothetical protein